MNIFDRSSCAREAREARAREARWKTQNKGAEKKRPKNDQKMTNRTIKWPKKLKKTCPLKFCKFSKTIENKSRNFGNHILKNIFLLF